MVQNDDIRRLRIKWELLRHKKSYQKDWDNFDSNRPHDNGKLQNYLQSQNGLFKVKHNINFPFDYKIDLSKKFQQPLLLAMFPPRVRCLTPEYPGDVFIQDKKIKQQFLSGYLRRQSFIDVRIELDQPVRKSKVDIEKIVTTWVKQRIKVGVEKPNKKEQYLETREVDIKIYKMRAAGQDWLEIAHDVMPRYKSKTKQSLRYEVSPDDIQNLKKRYQKMSDFFNDL